MKLYRNYMCLSDGIMCAEDLLDKYLDYPHGLANVCEITMQEAVVAVLDEYLKMSTKVKEYLINVVESQQRKPYEYNPKDWEIAVDIIIHNKDNKE